MKVVPYAVAIGSIRYAMLCTAMCLARCLARGYKSDLAVDHWTTVKIVLRNKEMFLGYGGDKEFVVKAASMQALTLFRMTLSLNLDTY